jgi:hypothetical protein
MMSACRSVLSVLAARRAHINEGWAIHPVPLTARSSTPVRYSRQLPPRSWRQGQGCLARSTCSYTHCGGAYRPGEVAISPCVCGCSVAPSDRSVRSLPHFSLVRVQRHTNRLHSWRSEQERRNSQKQSTHWVLLGCNAARLSHHVQEPCLSSLRLLLAFSHSPRANRSKQQRIHQKRAGREPKLRPRVPIQRVAVRLRQADRR